MNHAGTHFVITSRDKQVREFNFRSGKRVKQYDESLAVYEQASRDGTLGIETLDFGRRVAVERELEESEALNTFNAVFDESDNFLIFATMIGIKIVSLSSSRVLRVLGRVESGQRFLSVSLYQGIPRVDTQYMLAKHAGAAKYATLLFVFCQMLCHRLTVFLVVASAERQRSF